MKAFTSQISATWLYVYIYIAMSHPCFWDGGKVFTKAVCFRYETRFCQWPQQETSLLDMAIGPLIRRWVDLVIPCLKFHARFIDVASLFKPIGSMGRTVYLPIHEWLVFMGSISNVKYTVCPMGIRHGKGAFNLFYAKLHSLKLTVRLWK